MHDTAAPNNSTGKQKATIQLVAVDSDGINLGCNVGPSDIPTVSASDSRS